MRRYTLWAVTALLVLIPSHATVRAEPPLYTVQDLGNFNGAIPSIAGVNASGDVVGTVNGSLAVRRLSGGVWEPVPGVGNIFSVASGINAGGDIVGYYFNAAFQLRAFRYNRATDTLDDVPPLPGGTMTVGFAINAAGDVVGYSDSTDGSIAAFRATPAMAPAALPSLGGNFSLACGINDTGQVAGIATTPSGGQHAMRIDNAAAFADDIAGFDGPAGTAAACAIDAAGRVGGQAERSGQTHAFRYTPGAGLLDLDAFGSPMSNVESMAAGVSVGWYTVAGGQLRAFAHRDADGSFDLNTRIDAPGWVLGLAKAVNANGVIAGDGTLNGAPAAFLLTPVADAADTTPPVFTSLTATPSVIVPPKGQTVAVSIDITATDDSGEPPVCKLGNITGPGTAPDDFNVTGALTGTVRAVGGRTYSFNALCVDKANNVAWKSVDVSVPPDTTAPVIASVSATPSNLWPPDGRLAPVTVAASAWDDVDAAPVCALTGITGGGATDDAVITGPLSATLRAVGGRTYSLTVRCSDAAGNSSSAAATAIVPADTTAPVITSLSATPAAIWPANNKWVAVSLAVSATDDVDAAPVCGLTGITGAAAADSAITGPFSANVKASKNADGSVRTYLLEVSCHDNARNTSVAAVTVSVSKDGQQKVIHYNSRKN